MPVYLDEPWRSHVMVILTSRSKARRYRALRPWWAPKEEQR